MAPPIDTGADSISRAVRLVRLFHRDTDAFGRFMAVEAMAVPQPFRGLLDHASHMTVAMERLYGGPVDVVVKGVCVDDVGAADGREWYEREILLRSPAGNVVQHGIVRLDLARVSPPVAADIRAAKRPLGRILIEAGMLLDIQRVALVRVDVGPEFRALVGDDAVAAATPGHTFGRVAEIAIDGARAVELLEIVVPGPLPKVLP